jgi:tetratricopeptide (TPR) repeat protein
MLNRTMLRMLFITMMALCALSSGVLAQQTQPAAKSPAMQAADSLFQGKKWAEAARSYEEVTKAEPANAEAWFNYGMSLYSMDKFAEAAAVFTKANEAGKGTRIGRLSLYNIAASYARAGEKEKALDSLSRMVATNPLFGIGIATDADFESLRAEPRFKEAALTVEKAQKPCMFEAGYRQFDFFMGDWDVFVQGRKVGESHTKVLQQGCIIEENWVTPIQTGQSFNFYNPVTKKWHQSYMDSNGGNYMMDGEYKDGALRYEGFIYSPQGQIPVRMTFYNLEPGKLRQTSETSSDGGKTWVQGWDGLYVRQKSAAAVNK